MNHKDYFKLQAKNLLKDYKTRYSYYDEEASVTLYQYQPKFFDIAQIFIDFGIDDDKEDFKFTLMNSQHIIANLAGFKKWNELEKASDSELELAHLIFDNAHKISLEEWKDYIAQAENDTKKTFDIHEKLAIFKQVFLSSDSFRSVCLPYRTDLEKKRNVNLSCLNEENICKQDLYYELTETEKLNAIKEHKESGFADYALDDIVECLHCGSRYKFCEVKAIRSKEPYREEDDFDAIVCKNYPKCDGTIIDLIKVEETHNRKREGKNSLY